MLKKFRVGVKVFLTIMKVVNILKKFRVGINVFLTIMKLLTMDFITKNILVRTPNQYPVKCKRVAIVVFSRFHMDDERFRLCGSGRMQLELIKALESCGYTVLFFGQEDDIIENSNFKDAQLVVALATAAWRIPHTYKGLVWILTANSNVFERGRRNRWIENKYGLVLHERPVMLKHLYAYKRADVLYIAENCTGLYHHIFNGIPSDKIVTYNNCTDLTNFNRSVEYSPNPVGQRKFVAWMTASIRKGLPLLLNTWINWRTRGGATLTIIGMKTRETDDIIAMYSEKLIYCDYISLNFGENEYHNLSSVLEKYDVAIFPTFEDAQPSQLLEVAAIGYPIITTYESGVAFPDDFCSYISPWYDVSLERALEHWNNSEERILKQASRSSRKYISENHNWESFGERFLLALKKYRVLELNESLEQN